MSLSGTTSVLDDSDDDNDDVEPAFARMNAGLLSDNLDLDSDLQAGGLKIEWE